MNWEPFKILENQSRAEPPRPIDSKEGVGDRLRAAAFAEIQAREAFLYAAEKFRLEAPTALLRIWTALAKAEDRHLGWLLNRMQELGISVQEKGVSLRLWQSLVDCETPEKFSIFMARAEERGRQAGERFYKELTQKDPVTAEIFRKIAEEEVAHIYVSFKYYPEESARLLPYFSYMAGTAETTLSTLGLV